MSLRQPALPAGAAAMHVAIACLVFVLAALSVYTNFEMTLGDADTAWHLAAGDLIRAKGLPATDPWSFTAGNTPWINLAWAWDVWTSVLHEYLGWHGMVAFFAMICGLTMALLYAACILKSGNGIASFFTVCLAVISMPVFLRSMWVSNLFLMLIFLLALLVQYRGWNVKWWYVMPLLMPAWVNLHGGFVTAFIILGAFGLQALVARDVRTVAHLTMAGLLSIAGLTASPYGFAGVIDVVAKTFTTPALKFIGEFQPTVLSWSFLVTRLYIPVFFILAIWKKPNVSLAEAILGFGMIPLAITSERYWTFMYLFSGPILAQYFAQALKSGGAQGNEAFMRFADKLYDYAWVTHGKITTCLAVLLTVIASLAVLTPQAAKQSKLASLDPYSMFKPGIEFARTHYPNHRFLTDYTVSGYLIGASNGTFPVFIDSRGENSYPRQVVVDYIDFVQNRMSWQKIFDRYRLDGLILLNFFTYYDLGSRFEERKGFKRVYRDKAMEIYVRERQ